MGVMNRGMQELMLAGKWPPPPDSMYYATPQDIDDACARWRKETHTPKYTRVADRRNGNDE